ncbi:MAG: response regulator [Bacteroidetes bacterium]|jgi:CheY-like chemotaxis protein|nr:response regulator [Bacteroidota bacterium]
MKKAPQAKNVLKVLIVEDEYTNMFFLKSTFKGHTFEVVPAANGDEAVNIFRESPDFDLVLMDLKLPVMSGFEATEKIKKIRADVPIIAVTAYALRGDKEKALAAGCDDYIAKPFLKTELLDVINRHIDIHFV